MSYRDPAYVIFDGDNDKWAYAFMNRTSVLILISVMRTT
jgi:hypothetical protein